MGVVLGSLVGSLDGNIVGSLVGNLVGVKEGCQVSPNAVGVMLGTAVMCTILDILLRFDTFALNTPIVTTNPTAAIPSIATKRY